MAQGVLDGKYDDLSEQSFYMVGGIDEVIAKAEKIAKESAAWSITSFFFFLLTLHRHARTNNVVGFGNANVKEVHIF